MTAPTEPSESPDAAPRGLRARISPDWAYLAPMMLFLLLTGVVGQTSPWFPLVYGLKAATVAGMLIWFWPLYTRIRWSYWWLGLLLGFVGLFQWVGMQHWLADHFAFFKPAPTDQCYNPFDQAPWLCWTYIIVRTASATLVVPVMEELFWRDYLWRRIIAPNDFQLAKVGEWDWKAFVFVALAFSTVHGSWFPTAIVWGLMIGGLLAYTRSLGACMIMHATTNLLLAIHVVRMGELAFW